MCAQAAKNEDEFYIGWMPKAPKHTKQFLRKYIAVILIGVALLGITLALSQKQFATSNFEYGTLTQVKGIYFNHPIPMLKVFAGKDVFGDLSYISIPLVGYGKHGADGVMAALEKENNTSLNQREITLSGTLLYHDGKTILQVDGNDKPLKYLGSVVTSSELLPKEKKLGPIEVKGEIIDPKCYFGVMKPGEGKPHRDCAIRCILGGIPPMLAVKNKQGEANYYLIVGPKGEKMNTQVQDYVAEPVVLQAEAFQYDDWVVLYVKDKQPIRRISGLSLVRNEADVVGCGMLACKK